MHNTTESLARLSIVMVGTTHPGNIGAAARAMQNMGVTDLRLVAPRVFPSAEATARASGATGVLDGAQRCATLPEAIADCTVVIGASARIRTIAWPELSPKECAVQFLPELARGGRIAVLFGREHSGLNNEELDLCHFLLHIPCNPHFSSLNVAAAIQVATYEFFQAHHELRPGRNLLDEETGRPATGDEMESFYGHLRQTLFDIGFFHARKSSPSLMRRLRRLFNRAHLRDKELHILRGILRQAQERIARLEKARAIQPPDGNPLQ
ncbi:MAG TPA: RNA methyltransferase [Methylococcaceae bacterium]|nr:RNA methyltransferase [Methylococcaceae bacterium]